MNKNKILRNFLVISILLIVLCPLVSAFGVSSPYGSTKKPLEMYPGETKIVSLTLQNMGNEKDVTVKAEIEDEAGIVSLNKLTSTYSVLADSQADVELKVKLPEDAQIGKKYPIKISFNQVSKEEGGMVQMALGAKTGFSVIVVEKPAGVKKEIGTEWIILGIAVIIALIVIIYFIIKRRKK